MNGLLCVTNDHVFDSAFVYGSAYKWAFVCYYRMAQFIAREILTDWLCSDIL